MIAALRNRWPGLFSGRGRPRTISLGHAAMPEGLRVYCIGDIHGRADLLARVLAAVAEDLRGHDGEVALVTLGDYVDRGPDTAQVLDMLAAGPLPGITFHPLIGNHEVMLLSARMGSGDAMAWLTNGGDATLASYGIDWRSLAPERGFPELADVLRRRMPQGHVDFLRRCALTHAAGDYLFVHAGIRPGVPLAQQRPEDLVGIRRPFLDAAQLHEKVVVHGHTIVETPEVCRNRIGIDTGAYASDVLTCLCLEGRGYRFLAS
ncbi:MULTISPECIES: metallophosphoesterase [Chelatococcus]|uniref:Serine/threonine protein phosphatase 1 n=1 Tax=Chelatococcus caeni TaxID=1348468 RepID=A0A840BXZ8_9HYPH|nr:MULTISPECIES: metallophosphoesterase [Chelatococcus]MBB4017860.1 serine/threonine protein phosphatase 1 [Chelatococcus caeni]